MRQTVLVVCWLGVIQGALLAAYFFSISKGNTKKILLATILTLVSIRAAKSTLFVYSSLEYDFLLNIGFAAHAAIAPALLLFLASLDSNSKFTWRSVIHFIPASLLLALSPLLTLERFWYRGGYAALLIYTIIYVLYSGYYFIKNIRGKLRPDQERWTISLFAVFTVFLLAYFTNYILRLNSYLSGTVAYSLLIFVISFIVLRYNQLLTVDQKRKYQNLKLTAGELKELGDRVLDAYTVKRLFVNSDFSLEQLSKSAKIPEHILSYVFSEYIGKSFVQFTNEKRVEEAKRLFEDESKSHFSISGIAFESGFNSLTAFNSAFKKFNHTTPSEFRKQLRHRAVMN